jgi:hypothetical protein
MVLLPVSSKDNLNTGERAYSLNFLIGTRSRIPLSVPLCLGGSFYFGKN